MGLQIERQYITGEEKVEFTAFVTPEDFVYCPPAPRGNDEIVSQVVDEEQKHSEEIVDLDLGSKCASLVVETNTSLLELTQDNSLTTCSTTDGKIKTPTQMSEGALNSDEETSSSSEDSAIQNSVPQVATEASL